MSLRLDWCSHDAARYAVEHWHYSKSMPAGKIVKIGAWEQGQFIGCVLFSRGANNNIGKPYGLSQIEVCELTRVALSGHVAPVSRIVSIAIKMLRTQSPGIRLIVSYADPEQGHIGGIYQAICPCSGSAYTGHSQAQREVALGGAIVHKRTINSMFGSVKGFEKSAMMWKHKYVCPLDAAMKAQIEPLRKPYPKRVCAESIAVDAPGVQPGEDGATPISALQYLDTMRA